MNVTILAMMKRNYDAQPMLIIIDRRTFKWQTHNFVYCYANNISNQLQ